MKIRVSLKYFVADYRNIKFALRAVPTKNIFNVQEWLQSMQNCRSLFQEIFVVFKTFTMGIKTKKLPRTTKFCLWSFYEGVL